MISDNRADHTVTSTMASEENPFKMPAESELFLLKEAMRKKRKDQRASNLTNDPTHSSNKGETF